MQPEHIDHITAGCFAARIAYDLVPTPEGNLRYVERPSVRTARYVYPPAAEALREQGYRALR